MALTLQRSPRVFAWIGVIDDLSGLEPADDHWIDIHALPPTLLGLLHEAGRGYVPLMLANARSLHAGSKVVHTVIDGQPWEQQAVAYQGKCLRWLREEFAALGVADQAAASAILERAGCAALIHEPIEH
jgi:hypothetical protein